MRSVTSKAVLGEVIRTLLILLESDNGGKKNVRYLDIKRFTVQHTIKQNLQLKER